MQFKLISEKVDKINSINALLTLVSFDQSTQTPKNAVQGIEKMTAYLVGQLYDELNDKNLIKHINEVDEQQLNDKNKAIYNELKHKVEEYNLIPKQQYEDYQILKVKAFVIWKDAKNNNDFKIFKDTLQQIIDYQIMFAKYKQKDEKTLYDVVLKTYEPGFDSDKLDEFFGLLKAKIVPLLKKIQDTNIKFEKPYNKIVDKLSQQKFNEFIAEYVGFDLDSGLIKESEHPFTTHIFNKDVRFTTNYDENNIEDAIFSTIHEAGHGMYEQGISDEITFTNIGKGTSMGMHESQSRFYENMIARNKNFWILIFDKLNQEYKLDMDLDYFVNYINAAQASLIRTQADELTYPLHIMIRYEIEKQIFNNNLNVQEINVLWKKMYKEYLGVDVINDSEGILQDVHWSAGLFGYFPSYAIGSAISAQLYDFINKQFCIDDALRNQDLIKIKKILNTSIHKYGKTYNCEQLLNMMMNEGFNPQYYIDYLENKYSKLYNLK